MLIYMYTQVFTTNPPHRKDTQHSLSLSPGNPVEELYYDSSDDSSFIVDHSE